MEPMQGLPTTTFFGKLVTTMLGACACALSAGMMLQVDRLNAETSTVVLLVGVSAYLLAAFMVIPLTVVLRRILS